MSSNKPSEEQTQAAWMKLQDKLTKETKHPLWDRWSRDGINESANSTAVMFDKSAVRQSGMMQISQDSVMPTRLTPETSQKSEAHKHRLHPLRSLLHRRSKWISGAAVLIIAAAVIATPIGNNALASILNKFRMQQLTVVNEADLNQFFNSTFGDGKTREAVSDFGTFTRTESKNSGEADASQLEKLLGRKIVIPKDFNTTQQKVYYSGSSSLTLSIHADKVNEIMQRLGAKKLLPAALDGKPITLGIGESVQMFVNDGKQGYSFSQMPLPTITVDPSIPVSEAIDTILDFPLMPDSLKQPLREANILNGGNVPLPVVSNGTAEKLTLQGVDVILTVNSYEDSNGNTQSNKKNESYYVTWVKDGQLYSIYGDSKFFTSRKALLDKVSELIQG